MKRNDIPFMSFEKIIDPFLNAAKGHSGHLFVRIRGKEGFVTYTYAETVDRVGKIARYLKDNGFVSGGRAAIAGENCPEGSTR